MLQWRIGHERRADQIWHHHDGRTAAVATHLPLGRHGTLLLEALAAHGYIDDIQVLVDDVVVR